MTVARKTKSRHSRRVRYWDTASTINNLLNASTISALQSAMVPFQNAYGFKVYVDGTGSDGTGVSNGYPYVPMTVDDVPQLKLALKQVVEEYSHYPPAFIANLSKFDSVFWIHQFSDSDQNTFNGDQVIGLTVYNINAIYYTLFTDPRNNRGFGTGSDAYRNVLHHELMHIIDVSYLADRNAQQANWEGSNPAGWAYTPSNDTIPPGFVTGYANTNYAEDRAETMTWNMTGYQFWSMIRKRQADDALNTKSNLISTFLQGHSNAWTAAPFNGGAGNVAG